MMAVCIMHANSVPFKQPNRSCSGKEEGTDAQYGSWRSIDMHRKLLLLGGFGLGAGPISLVSLAYGG
jgi:hypothetical protein